MKHSALWLLLAVAVSACAGHPGAMAPAAVPTAATMDAPLAQMQSDPSRMIVVAVANPPEVRGTHAGSSPRGYDLVGAYDSSGSSRATLAAVQNDYALSPVSGWPIQPLGVDCVVMRLHDGDDRAQVLERLTHDPRVRIAQPLQEFRTLGEPSGDAARYNDPYLGLQSGFATIGAAHAQQSTRGAGVRIALIDTGVDTAHPDLAGRISRTRDFVDVAGTHFERERHGTEVAGVIAAVANNGLGIVGVAPEVRIEALRACWQLSDGSGARCNSFTLAQALADAIASGVDIVNLSLGGPPNPLLSQLVSYGQGKGIVFVGAVAPDGVLDRFPVGIAGVLAVDKAAQRDVRTEAVLGAPGDDVLSLEPAGGYGYSSGSSLSTAYVTAATALILSQHRSLPAASVREALLRSASARDGGAIDVCRALSSLDRKTRCGDS